MPKVENTPLHDMFVHALADMYYAENKIYKVLPKVIKAAQSSQLKSALNAHHKQTAGHIKQLEKLFKGLGKKARGHKCDAIDGILKESDSIIKEFGKTAGCDAAIVFACQAVEHYEVTRYGTMRRWAITMGNKSFEHILTKLRDQEGEADQKLTDLAIAGFNSIANEGEEAAGDVEPRRGRKARKPMKKKM